MHVKENELFSLIWNNVGELFCPMKVQPTELKMVISYVTQGSTCMVLSWEGAQKQLFWLQAQTGVHIGSIVMFMCVDIHATDGSTTIIYMSCFKSLCWTPYLPFDMLCIIEKRDGDDCFKGKERRVVNCIGARHSRDHQWIIHLYRLSIHVSIGLLLLLLAFALLPWSPSYTRGKKKRATRLLLAALLRVFDAGTKV